MPRRVETEAIVAAYRETGSVWKAGKRLGLAGQTVHERLRAIGHPLGSRQWDDDEIGELRALMGAGVRLGEIAARLGRTYAAVACKASREGAPSAAERPVKLPRGKGYDKVSTRRHLRALMAYDGPITRYARANGLTVDSLVGALQRHFPEWWEHYAATHSDIPRRKCEYCERVFIPTNARQRYCTRQCGSDALRDEAYFGGRRRTTIGLAEGICQLCGRERNKGLHSHHIIGKQNDPDNELLIALCQGCHHIVEQLAARKMLMDDPCSLESLISLAWLRRHGGLPEGDDSLRVAIEIETYADAENQAA